MTTPNHPAALVEKALSVRRTGDHAVAVNHSDVAMESDPDAPGIKLELARDLRALNRHAK